MNDVIRYDAVMAGENAVDRFDADNFYPMDGMEDDFYDESIEDSYEDYDDVVYDDFSGLDTDEDGVDSEFSEALGDRLKGLFQKKSTPSFGGASGGASRSTKKGLFGGKLRALISDRQAGLDDRLSAREDRIRRVPHVFRRYSADTGTHLVGTGRKAAGQCE